jgi:ABC-type glycerol-3-phosphate transport system substrate-binding protein
MMGIVARVAPTLNFSVQPIKKRGTQDLFSFTGGRAWAIPRDAKDPEAAWEFIKFMTALDTWKIGADAVKASQETQGRPYIPSLTADKAADQMQIEQVYVPIAPQFDAAVKLFPQILEKSETRQISNSPVSNQLNDIMDQTGVDPALRKEKSPQDALDEATTKAQEAVDTFGV